MEVKAVYNDLIIIGLFLFAGFMIREHCRVLQKLFIPASLIGGVVALLLGPQVLDLVPIPKTFGKYPGSMVNIVMAAISFGISLNKKSATNMLDYTPFLHSIYSMQMWVGIVLGVVIEFGWPGLFKGWGSFGVFCFEGGHGNAAAAARVFANYGINEAMSVGMLLATFGLVLAMVVGMILANWGIRKGYASYVKEVAVQPAYFYGGPQPKEKQQPIGHSVTAGFNINHLALQFMWLAISISIGRVLVNGLGLVWKGASMMPGMVQGIVGSMILWPILQKIKLDRFVDLKIIKQISGFCLEIIILTATATLKLDFLATYIVPLVLFTGIMMVLTGGMIFFVGKRTLDYEWFEKCMMAFGVCMGNSATGMALVRAVDPDNVSVAPASHGLYNTIFCWKHAFPALIPIWIQTGYALPVGIGMVMCFGCLAVSFLYFGRHKIKVYGSMTGNITGE